jgi:hypothetical protein
MASEKSNILQMMPCDNASKDQQFVFGASGRFNSHASGVVTVFGTGAGTSRAGEGETLVPNSPEGIAFPDALSL